MDARPDLFPLAGFLHRIFPPGSYPKTGESLASERLFQPRKRSQGLHLELPIDWEAADTEDRNWRMQLQGWTMFHPVMNVFDSLRNKDAAIDYFFDIVGDWWGVYGDDPDDIVTSRTPESYAWYDMSVGFRALILAFFGNRIQHFGLQLSNDRRQLLQALVEKHASHLREPKVLYRNNHGIFQMHGLKALAECFQFVEAEECALYAQGIMAELLSSQFDERGVHREHSPQYHFFVLDTFDSVYGTRWYDDSSVAMRLEKAKEALIWLVDPNRAVAAVGDSNPTIMDVTFPVGSASEELLISPYTDSGYAIVRSNWDQDSERASYLFFMGAYNSKVHKHRDCLSFEWFCQGYKRITDAGKYGYYGDDWRRYMLSNRAHSTLEIEGLDMLRMRPYGSAIEHVQVEEAALAVARGSLRFKAIEHERTLYLGADGWMVVHDAVEFNRPRAATQWFHIGLGHQFRSLEGNRARFQGPDDQQLIIESVAPSVRAAVHFGDVESMQGFVSTEDDRIEPGWVIGYQFESQREHVLTILAVGDESFRVAERFADTIIEREARGVGGSECDRG